MIPTSKSKKPKPTAAAVAHATSQNQSQVSIRWQWAVSRSRTLLRSRTSLSWSIRQSIRMRFTSWRSWSIRCSRRCRIQWPRYGPSKTSWVNCARASTFPIILISMIAKMRRVADYKPNSSKKKLIRRPRAWELIGVEQRIWISRIVPSAPSRHRRIWLEAKAQLIW